MASVRIYQCAKKTVWKPPVRGPVDPFLRSGGGEYGVEVGFGSLFIHVDYIFYGLHSLHET